MLPRSILFGPEATFPVAMFIFATSMGLYQVDAWNHLKSMQIRLLGAGLLAGLMAFVLMSFAPSLALAPDGLVFTVAIFSRARA